MPKKQNAKNPSVRVNDLRAKKNPKGGASDIVPPRRSGDAIKGESPDELAHADSIAVLSTSLTNLSPVNFKPKTVGGPTTRISNVKGARNKARSSYEISDSN